MSEVKPGNIYSVPNWNDQFMVLSIQHGMAACILLAEQGFWPWDVQVVAESKIINEWTLVTCNKNLLSESLGMSDKGFVKRNAGSRLISETKALKIINQQLAEREDHFREANSKLIEMIRQFTEVLSQYA